MPRLFVGVVAVVLIVANSGASWIAPRASVAVAATGNCARMPPPSTPSFIAQAFTSAVAAQQNVPGVALELYVNGRFYPYYTGYAVRAPAVCIDEDTIMEIGSLTKSFTAILLAMAYTTSSPLVSPAQSPVGLIDALSAGNTVGPGCRPSSITTPRAATGVMQYATLQTLSSFTAGLPDDPPPPWGNLRRRPCWSANQFIRFVERYPSPNPVPPPPYPYLYSNMSYGTLGYVLQGVYKKPWFQITQEQLLAPLGMVSTYAAGHAPQPRFAQGYGCDGTSPAQYWTLDPWPAAGALRSTLRDMTKYLGALVSLPSTPPNVAAGVHVAVRPIARVNANVQQAMAFAVVKHGNYYVTGKDGGTAGFNAWIGAILPDSNPSSQPIGIVVLTNRNPTRCRPAPANTIGLRILLAVAQASATAGSQPPR